MNLRILRFSRPLFFTIAISLVWLFQVKPVRAATILWTGLADGVSWSNTGNWSNGIPPTAVDNAVISGINTSVTIILASNVTVQSLQCSASLNLAGGGLALTTGASQVSGNLTIGSSQSLSASGDTTTFVAPGQTIADDANFNVTGGATIQLPGLSNYNKGCYGANWTVTGANSLLSLPGLTNFYGAACNYPTIQVSAGGQLLATNLTTILEAPLTVLADGTNSLVNFSSLLSASSESGYPLQFTVQNGGTILIPRLTNAPSLDVAINPGGMITVAQFQQLGVLSLNGVTNNFTNLRVLGGLTVSGITQVFPSVTNFYDANFNISGGAVVTLPELQTYGKNCSGGNWTVTGSNSVLSLPALTNIVEAVCGFPGIQVTAGAQLLATNLTSILAGPQLILADGTNSLVSFPALQSASGQGGYDLQFTAQNGGEVLIPLLTNAPLLDLSLAGGGIIPTAQFRQLGVVSLTAMTANYNNLQSLGGFAIRGVNQSFPAVTNLDGANLTVSGGAAVTLPALLSYNKLCSGANWTITDSNSVLSFPQLASITGGVCGTPTIQILAGGQLQATNLESMMLPAVTLLVDGTNSLANFPALQVAAGGGGYGLQFTAQNGGEIYVPLLAIAPTLNLTLNSGGMIQTAQFQQLGVVTLDGVSANLNQLVVLGGLTITGANASLPGVTNFDGGNVTINGGAKVSLPALVNYNKLCSGAYWMITGSNSVLSLPALTNFSGEVCSTPTIQILAGGQLQATNLLAMTAPATTLLVDGSNSLANFPVLQAAAGGGGYFLQFTVQNGGEIWVPHLTNAPTVELTINPGTVIPTAQFNQLGAITLPGVAVNFNRLTQLGGLTVDEVTQNFPAVTNFDGADAIVSGGAVVTLPALQNYNKQCSGADWTVTGANSVLSLPALTNFTGSVCNLHTIQAEAGGQLLATNLVALTGPAVTFLADGSGSALDFPALRSAGDGSYLAQFIAQNGGSLIIPLLGAVDLVGITAQSAGQVNMSQVQGISGSSVAITSTGAGSVIDLSDLSAFSTPLGASSLTATNSGVILLNNNVFLLENVAINWAGSPALPAATIASSSLSLYGQPWHSYRVDVMPAGGPSNSWQFYARVPLTNAVQLVGSTPGTGQTFRVYEFQANPPILDLISLGQQLGQFVLYGLTNQTYRVETTSNLSSLVSWLPWSPSISMTNSFRIFAPTNLAAPAQFFRGREL
jgi:hypothetical protein